MEESARWVQRSGSSNREEGQSSQLSVTGEKGRITQSVLKRYWSRPEAFEQYSLFKLHLTHKWVKGKWNKCKNENIVRIWP